MHIIRKKKTKRCIDLERDEILSCVLFSIAPTKKSRHIIAKIHVGRTAIGAEAEQSVCCGPRELEQRRDREVRDKKTVNVRVWRCSGPLIESVEWKKEDDTKRSR